MATRKKTRKKRARAAFDTDNVAFTLTPVRNPLERGTLGDVGAFFRVTADRPFTNAQIEIPYRRSRSRRVDEKTLRLFWWDEEHRSLILVSPSGVEIERRRVWGRIAKAGTYGAIGLPLDSGVRRTITHFCLFSVAELQASPALVPKVCGLILCADPLAAPPAPGSPCDLCLGLRVPDGHLPECQLLRIEPPLRVEVEPVGPAPVWAVRQCDYRQTGQSSFNGPARTPAVSWSFRPGPPMMSAPVVLQ
jgi:hypothetical protein